jgi:hypothetical protein
MLSQGLLQRIQDIVRTDTIVKFGFNADQRYTFLMGKGFPSPILEQLTYDGNHNDFVTRLVFFCQDYGKIDGKKLALVHLLEIMRQEINEMLQPQIDRLINEVIEEEKLGVLILSENSDIIEGLNLDEVKTRVIERGKQLRIKKRRYPDFDIEIWKTFSCTQLTDNENDIAELLGRKEKMLGLIIDQGLFESQEKVACTNQICKVLGKISPSREQIIATIERKLTNLNVPSNIQLLTQESTSVKDLSELTQFIWYGYDDLRKKEGVIKGGVRYNTEVVD